MSAYKKIQTQFKQISSLQKALSEVLGHNNFEVDIQKRNRLPLFGYQNDQRPETCSVRIDRKFVNRWSSGVSNDIGFAWDDKSKTFQAIVSDYDRNQIGSQRLLDRIRQEYAFQEISRQARSKGYRVRKQSTGDGTIQVQLISTF